MESYAVVSPKNLSPRALRKELPEKKNPDRETRLYLEYRSPYRYEEMLDFLLLRAIPGVEQVTGKEYLRTVKLLDADKKYVSGWIRISHVPRKKALALTLSESLLPILPEVLAGVRHLFDLYCDPETVYEKLAPMNDIRPGLCVPGTRLPGSFDAFEMVVRAVLGQQITVKAARTLAGRLVNAFGSPVKTGIAGLTHTFPFPEDILSLDGKIENHLGPLGIIARRAQTIGELARAFVQGAIDFSPLAEPKREIEKLLAIPGIGNWTARYIAMRTMGWTDAFLETDAGVKKALAPLSAGEMLRMAEAWRPWRSYGTINLWNSLGKK